MKTQNLLESARVFLCNESINDVAIAMNNAAKVKLVFYAYAIRAAKQLNLMLNNSQIF